jgi:ribosomal protein L11 methyltransferase
VTWQARDEQDLFESPLDSTPLWQNVKISALFADDTPLRPLIDALQAEFNEKIIFACRCESLAEQVWERVWLNEFKPMRFGKNLWVCPTAYQALDQTAANIILDPTLAFGSGTHPSTALPAGQCVLAGILRDQLDSVQRVYSQTGFRISDISYKQDWACLVGNSA